MRFWVFFGFWCLESPEEVKKKEKVKEKVKVKGSASFVFVCSLFPFFLFVCEWLLSHQPSEGERGQEMSTR